MGQLAMINGMHKENKHGWNAGGAIASINITTAIVLVSLVA